MHHHQTAIDEQRKNRLLYEGPRRNTKTNPHTQFDHSTHTDKKHEHLEHQRRTAYVDRYGTDFRNKAGKQGERWGETWSPTLAQQYRLRGHRPPHRFRPGAIRKKPTRPRLFGNILAAQIPSGSIPTNFDAREQWKSAGIGTSSMVYQQGVCGDCYVFATTEMLQQRLSIALGYTVPRLSQLFVLEQMPYKTNALMKCNGGDNSDMCAWLASNDIAEDSFMPYDQWQWASINQDPSKLSLPSNYSKKSADLTIPDNVPRWRASTSYTVSDNGNDSSAVENIQRDIMTKGPVSAYMEEYDDFQESFFFDASKQNTVYRPSANAQVAGGHLILLCGWGVDSASGSDYWLVQNSWGLLGGIDSSGFFKIARGEDCCSIESQVVAVDITTDDAQKQANDNNARKNNSQPNDNTSPNSNTTTINQKTKTWIITGSAALIVMIILMITLTTFIKKPSTKTI